MPLDVPVNTILTRAVLNQQYGGGIQGGMLTPAGGKLMFLFSDPKAGALHGYDFDGWETGSRNAVFFYTGEGTDQRFVRRNRILRDATVEGREVHLFLAAGTTPGSGQKQHQYVGVVRVDPQSPYRIEEGSDGFDKIVFRLLRDPSPAPLGAAATPTQSPTAEHNACEVIDGEEQLVTDFERSAHPAGISSRSEATLVKDYTAALGIKHRRLKIRVQGERATFWTDVWDEQRSELIEAKSSASS